MLKLLNSNRIVLFLNGHLVIEHVTNGVGSANGIDFLEIFKCALVICESELLEILLHFQAAEKLLLG